jgi:hypothetical protein
MTKTTQQTHKGENMTQHTPGPWTVHEVPEYLQTDFHYHIHGPGNGYFTPCSIYGDGIKNKGTALANARLIAAAPVMLEALKGLVAEAAKHPAVEYKPLRGALKVIQAAITQAEGR